MYVLYSIRPRVEQKIWWILIPSYSFVVDLCIEVERRSKSDLWLVEKVPIWPGYLRYVDKRKVDRPQIPSY